ncbi:hypothetical protein LIP_0737 [Limnochorda pilosa]|uniref:Ferrous iron transporter FeoA-like domain-containing protein n=2 Tax=Limnochorda pilosa TaxID=1555112 RepID=A0A0K2SIC6_LIMPI|nr:hypothetical protein LIP_0737 [Limnochorda pilosa]
MVQCSICGLRFDPDQEVSACQVCPLGGLIRRCGLVRCPNCGFEQPAPWGGRARARRRQRGQGPLAAGEGAWAAPVHLSDLAEGERARVLKVEARDAALRKLLAMGVLPGVEVTVVQRRPVLVVQVGYTTLALDGELARSVAVLRLEAGSGRGPGRGRQGKGPRDWRGGRWGWGGAGRGHGSSTR